MSATRISPADLPPGVWLCQHCTSPVVIRPIRDGRRWPFERTMQSADDAAEDMRFVPVRSGHGTVMVPARDMAPRRLEAIRWFAVRHTCAEWLRWFRDQQEARRNAREDADHSFADALEQILGMSEDEYAAAGRRTDKIGARR
jgi:hypothetical protein